MPTTLLQIFCKIIPFTQVIVKCILGPEDTFKGKSLRLKNIDLLTVQTLSGHCQQLFFKYFVKSFLLPKLLSNASKVQTTLSKGNLWLENMDLLTVRTLSGIVSVSPSPNSHTISPKWPCSGRNNNQPIIACKSLT